MLAQMDTQVKSLKRELLQLCWYMRGGVGYAEMMEMGLEERRIIRDIIDENIKTTEKTKLPFF